MTEYYIKAHKYAGKAVLAGLICILASATMWAVSSPLQVTHSGFTRNHANSVWSTTLKVTNQSTASVGGPIRVVLTNLVASATLMNASGSQDGNPYIVLTDESIAAGATATVVLKFTNPTNAFITFTPVATGGN